MLKEQLLVLFLTFNVPRFFCGIEKDLGAGKSFIELELFQEVILQYYILNCHYSCWDIVTLQFCDVEATMGIVSRDCEITSCAWLGTAKACASREGDHKFQWVSTNRDGKLYNCGKNHDSCSFEKGFEMYQIGDPNVVNDYSHCHCHCFKHNWKIFLGELRSRERDNYFIIGIRFKLQDKVFFLQPAEGRLRAGGKISELHWVPLPNNPSELHEISLESRSFFLDDLLLEPSYVVTGVKFKFMEIGDPQKIKGFAITISGVPFDYEARELDLTTGNRRIVEPDPSTPRRRLLFKPVNPVDMNAFNSYGPSLEKYNYIELQQSWIRADFGQSTLPLFNSSPITVDQNSPLTGIGIFHEGSVFHAGLISLRLYTKKMKIKHN